MHVRPGLGGGVPRLLQIAIEIATVASVTRVSKRAFAADSIAPTG